MGYSISTQHARETPALSPRIVAGRNSAERGQEVRNPPRTLGAQGPRKSKITAGWASAESQE